MPTYQYACTECGHRFEEVQAFTDPSMTDCPECAGRLRKVYGSVGVVFKGSGFYRTDSRSGSGEATATKSDSTSADKPAAKADSTSGATSNGKSGESGGSAASKPAAATSNGSASPTSSSTGGSSTKAAG